MVKIIARVKESIDTNDAVMDFVMCVVNSVTVTHIQHWTTDSYSKHIALAEYYDSVSDLIDSFVESFQGKRGVLTGFPSMAQLSSVQSPIEYMAYLSNEVAALRVHATFPQDSELQNIVDEIAALIDQTMFKLERLK
jgi:hypothetical protein